MNISEIKNINKLKEYRQFYIDLQNKLNEAWKLSNSIVLNCNDIEIAKYMSASSISALIVKQINERIGELHE